MKVNVDQVMTQVGQAFFFPQFALFPVLYLDDGKASCNMLQLQYASPASSYLNLLMCMLTHLCACRACCL